jgi:hypothetical protein
MKHINIFGIQKAENVQFVTVTAECTRGSYTALNCKELLYDRMTVHRSRFFVNKTNKYTKFQFYWYYYSTCFGQSFCPSSGVLRHISALVRFMQL